MKDEIKDIYDGDEVSCWEDDDFVTLSIGLTTVAVPKEWKKQLKKDLTAVAKKL